MNNLDVFINEKLKLGKNIYGERDIIKIDNKTIELPITVTIKHDFNINVMFIHFMIKIIIIFVNVQNKL